MVLSIVMADTFGNSRIFGIFFKAGIPGKFSAGPGNTLIVVVFIFLILM